MAVRSATAKRPLLLLVGLALAIGNAALIGGLIAFATPGEKMEEVLFGVGDEPVATEYPFLCSWLAATTRRAERA